MENHEIQIKEEIISMELIDIYYLNYYHEIQGATKNNETIDQSCFTKNYQSIPPTDTFNYKVFSAN